MKKLLLLIVLFFVYVSALKAQCGSQVVLDVAVNANSSNSYSITTANPNELIMIAYDGWNGPGSGPVKVDGNNATWIITAHRSNSGTAETYAYIAPAAGVHNIVCTPTGYNYPPYEINEAAAFYATSCATPISIASLTSNSSVITPATGGSVSGSIATTVPGSAIFTNSEINEGQNTSYPISWTGATFLENQHVGNGIEASIGYTSAATPGTYNITATNTSPPNNGWGGLCLALVVIPPPCVGAIITLTTSVSAAACSMASATVNPAGGTSPYTYLWTPSGQTTQTATGLSQGTYTVNITDSNGCTASTTVSITVPTAPVVTTTFVASCNGGSGSATANVAGGTVPYTYSWSNGATTSSITGLGPGTYTIIVTDANGCMDTNTATINPVASPTVTIASVNNVTCHGDSNGVINTSVSGGTAPFTYAWSPTGGTGASATGLKSGTYTVTVQDSNGCTSTVSISVTQPNVLAVTAIGAQMICIGNTATIAANPTGGTPPYTYNWTPSGGTNNVANVNPTVTTIYTVTVNDANNCGPVTATVKVSVRNPLSVTVGPNEAACPGDSASIFAKGHGGDSVYNYTWSPGGETGQTIKVSPSTTTWYTVTVTDTCGTTPPATDSVKVTIDPLPIINFTATPAAGCSPLCVTFNDLTTIASGTLKTWLWNMGNDSTYTTHPGASTCYLNPGNYNVTLTVTSDSGCVASRTINNMIDVYSHPKAQFSFRPQPTTITNPQIFFADNSTDAYGIATWDWRTFGDMTDSTSTKQYPVHTYQDSGTYCVTLIVTNIHGCIDSTTECVRIDPQYTLYIPSAFSPNNDGRNDVFQPMGNFISGFKMWIFDRWGNKIYYTEDMTKGWNGLFENVAAKCQEDTYIYVIEAIDGKNVQHDYMGRVSLIR